MKTYFMISNELNRTQVEFIEKIVRENGFTICTYIEASTEAEDPKEAVSYYTFLFNEEEGRKVSKEMNKVYDCNSYFHDTYDEEELEYYGIYL